MQEWGYSILDKARMGLRYGVESALKLEYFVDNLLKSFSTIYDKLDDPNTFYKTVEDFLIAMSPVSAAGDISAEMMNLTSVTLKEKLQSIGVGDLLIDELVTVATRVNYGQMPDKVHAFVGAVGLAGMDGDLWAVEGGNSKVAQCAAMRTRAKMYRAKVTQITRENDDFVVKFSNEGDQPKYESADVVILATPLTSDVSTIDLPEGVENNQFPGNYHKTVATIVEGELIPEAVGFKVRVYFIITLVSLIVGLGSLIAKC